MNESLNEFNAKCQSLLRTISNRCATKNFTNLNFYFYPNQYENMILTARRTGDTFRYGEGVSIGQSEISYGFQIRDHFFNLKLLWLYNNPMLQNTFNTVDLSCLIRFAEIIPEICFCPFTVNTLAWNANVWTDRVNFDHTINYCPTCCVKIPMLNEKEICDRNRFDSIVENY